MTQDISPVTRLDKRIDALQSVVDELRDLPEEDQRKVVGDLVDVYYGANALRSGGGAGGPRYQAPVSTTSIKTPRKEPGSDPNGRHPGVLHETLEWSKRHVAAQVEKKVPEDQLGFTNGDLVAWSGITSSGADQRIHVLLNKALIERHVRGRYLPAGILETLKK